MSQICKFASHLKEIRIHLCQTNSTSKGVREFIEKYYVDIKSNNPKFPILIRECSNIEPKLWARFERGKEYCISLSNLSAPDIFQELTRIASK